MNLDQNTLWVLSIIFFATLVRSTFGFGDALVAMPLLCLVIDVRIATPLIALISFTVAASIVFKHWRSVQVKSIRWLLPAASVGIPIGVFFLAHVDERVVKFFLGLLVILFSMFSLYRPQLLHLKNDRLAMLFGFTAGMLGGAYNTQGPPLVIYGTLRRWSAVDFRATLQGYFVFTGTLLLIFHSLAGSWSPVVWQYYLYSLPLLPVSIILGGRFNQAFPLQDFVRYVYFFLIAIAIMLLVDAVSGMANSGG